MKASELVEMLEYASVDSEVVDFLESALESIECRTVLRVDEETGKLVEKHQVCLNFKGDKE